MTLNPSETLPIVETFQLFDIAEAAAHDEAVEWGEEPGMNLYLEDSILLVRRELEQMPLICQMLNSPPPPADESAAEAAAAGDTTGDNATATTEKPIDIPEDERSRVFVMAGNFSTAVADLDHYKRITQVADVWIFGVPDVVFPTIPHVQGVALSPGTTITCERSVIVEGLCFGAALFAIEAGRLDEQEEASRYFEGFLTARPLVVQTAVSRLNALLKLPPLKNRRAKSRRISDELTLSWHSRLNARFLERLEGQKLALRARSRELENLLDDRRRLGQLANMARGYLGERTWHEFELAVDKGRSIIEDRREELTICFCDLVGFTRISERLHPTEVASILNDHYARLHDIVRGHGGWVDKFIGDAMLAIFENPVEAMTAAQKMVRETRSVQVTEQMKQAVQVRVGLNTGVVAVANLGVPERRERTVLGDAVNVAQRLQSVAVPQTVVISERTFARLPFSISRTLEPVDVEIRGRSENVSAYRWSVHSERRSPEESVSLRGSLLNAARRAPLSERLKGSEQRDAPTTYRPPSGDTGVPTDWVAIHEPTYEPEDKD